MFYLTAKFQKNRMNGLEYISERTDGRTDARTDGPDSLGLKRLRRETKKLGNSNVRFSEKMRKTSIFWHFGPKRPILDSFWPKWAKGDFFQKSAWNIFSAFLSSN